MNIDIVKVGLVREKGSIYGVKKVNSPSDLIPMIKRFIGDSDRENLIVCCLDVKNKPINVSVVSTGSINSSVVHPREVFKTAILSNANSIIVAHNHPSGDTEPSENDFNITLRLKECGEILGITLLDHIIIGDGYYSFKEHNLC